MLVYAECKNDHRPESQRTGIECVIQSLNTGIIDIPYTAGIEQSGAIMHGMNEYSGGLHPPSLHVGVLPASAYSRDEADGKVQELIAVF